MNDIFNYNNGACEVGKFLLSTNVETIFIEK